MKTLTSITILCAVLLLLTGCPLGYKYDTGVFPTSPVNMMAVNSAYDDYNSTSPVIESQRYLYFSSNRNSQGADFDIVGDHFRVFWDKDDGSLVVDDKPNSWKDLEYIQTLFGMVNSPANELGPYSMPYYVFTGNNYKYTDVLIYATDSTGSLDVRMAWFTGTGENPAPEDGDFFGPEPIPFLSGPANEAYLCFYGPDYFIYDYSVDPAAVTELLFCSDQDGDFDLYTTPLPADSNLFDFLREESGIVFSGLEALNSPGQDKCPFVNGELLVFASDRPGGFGGFDLYYSRRQGNGWSAPVNFGEKISSSYDEYRPIAFEYYEFENDVMIFSSNRPGGKGGFDLYYVGIPKMI